MPKGKGKHAVEATRLQDARAFELWVRGRLLREIGEELGLSESGAHRAVKRERARRAEEREDVIEEALEEALESTRFLYGQAVKLIPADGSSAVGQALKARQRIDDLLGVVIQKRVDVTSGGEALSLDSSAVAAAVAALAGDE